jgi:murein endopeptidase
MFMFMFLFGMSACVTPPNKKAKRSMSSVVAMSMVSPSDVSSPSSKGNHRCDNMGDAGVGMVYVPDMQGEWKVLCFQRTSHSIGTANNGGLSGGHNLGASGHGWIQKGRNGFGTNETVQLLRWAVVETTKVFPGSVPVYIGDLSQDGGGVLSPHLSHQSGRDVDLGYFHVDNLPLRRFVDASSDNLDSEKSWFLLERLLLTGRVQYVFMDYRVQEWLFLQALDNGWNEADLKKLFQYPRGPRAHRGKIRHAPGHLNHFHVRFVCPEGDEECVQ